MKSSWVGAGALGRREFSQAEIVGTCGEGPAAVAKVLELAPDVPFLDVPMPGGRLQRAACIAERKRD
jgi:AmiR/NasT family two-component response regulator